MKRSTRIKLLLMGTASLALSACGDDAQDAGVFTSVQECVDTGAYSEEDCLKGFEEAAQQHTTTAPRYASPEDCEADFGPGQCKTGSAPSGSKTPSGKASSDSASSDGGSFFVPLMMGYMLGNLMSDNRSPRAEPLYRPDMNRRDGGSNGSYRVYNPGSFRTARNAEVGDRSGMTRVKPSVLDIQPAGAGKSTTTLTRGGFGARAASLGAAS